ncbi:MAG: hypothetical protein AAB660_00390 [Patescibacteria group bacterium]
MGKTMATTISIFSESKLAKLVGLMFAVLVIWWLWIYGQGTQGTDDIRQLWAASYQILAIFGAIAGFFISKFWGGYNSTVGRAILMFSVGLLFQSFGQSVYSYYIYFAQIDVPYPSIGDVGFFGSIFFYIYGAFLLSKASGMQISLKSFDKKMQAFFIPLVVLALSYLAFLRNYEFDLSNKLKIFLDFGYPLGQALYISIAILVFMLSYKYLGGLMKKPLSLLLFALAFQYFSDYSFLYQASRGSWLVGGINDLFYAISYFLMSIALIYIGVTFRKIQEAN